MAMDTALPGEPLSDLGYEQAQALVDTLADEPIVAVYTSLAIRAQQTAAPLAGARKLPSQLLTGAHEIQAGDLEGRTDLAAIMTFAQVVRLWSEGDLSGSMPGGESGQQVQDRFLKALAFLRAHHEDQTRPDDVVVLVSHDAMIRCGSEWVADNVRPEVARKELIPNTGIVVLDSRPEGGWHCLSWRGEPM
jgi:probable phosphoglycerate mutase